MRADDFAIIRHIKTYFNLRSRIDVLKVRINEQNQQVEDLAFKLHESEIRLAEAEAKLQAFSETLDNRVSEAVDRAYRKYDR